MKFTLNVLLGEAIVLIPWITYLGARALSKYIDS
jgi:hypothetical protein